MSESRLELIHELNVAFNAGEDWSRFYDPEAELHTPPEWLDQSVYRGHDGLREVLRLWTESFDEYHWEEERLIDGPGGRRRALLPARAGSRGSRTGSSSRSAACGASAAT